MVGFLMGMAVANSPHPIYSTMVFKTLIEKVKNDLNMTSPTDTEYKEISEFLAYVTERTYRKKGNIDQ